MSLLLLSEKQTVFAHDLIERERWLFLARMSNELAERYRNELRLHGYSYSQDAWYFLNGCEPDQSPMGRAFATLAQDPSMQSLFPCVKDENIYTRINAVLAVSSAIRDVLDNLPPRSTVKQAIAAIAGIQMSLTRADIDDLTVFDACLGQFFTGEQSEIRATIESLRGLFDVKAFANLLGWARRIVGGEVSKQKSMSGEFSRYYDGELSPQTHAVDRMRLAMGDITAKIRALDSQMINVQNVTYESAGQGPVVLLLDRSGSMSYNDGGEFSRIQTLRSFVLALADAFNASGRELIAIWFNGSHVAPMHTFGDDGLKQFMEYDASGSTLIDLALAKGIDAALEYADNADILTVSDGYLGVNGHLTVQQQNEGYIQKMKPFTDAGGRAWAVIIGDPDKTELETWGWCNAVIGMDKITDENANLDAVLQEMARPRSADTTTDLAVV